MASSAVIGALRVNLGIGTAAFDKGLGGARANLARFAATAAKAMAVAAAGITAAVAGIGIGIKHAIDQADDMGKAAQRIGIPIEQLSRLAHVADLSGVSMETLGGAVARLSRNMADVASGAGQQAGRAFQRLGISVRNADGTLRSSQEVLTEVAERFSRLPDGAAKTATAMQLFGRAGAELIPLLNSGADGLQEMMQEADKLGLVIDQNTSAAAERFNDNLTRLGRVKDGIIMRLTAKLLPAFERFSQRLIDAAINGDWVTKIANLLSFALDGLAAAVNFVYQHMDLLLKVFKIFVAAKLIQYLAAATGAFLTFARMIKAAGLAMGALMSVQRIGVRGIALLAGVVALATGQFGKLEAAINSLWDKVKVLIPDEWRADFSGFFQDLDAADDAAAASLGTYIRTANDAALTFENAGGRVTRATGRAGIAITNSMESVKDTVQDVAQTLQGAFSSAFDAAIDGSFRLKDALADLLKQFARMLANAAFQKLAGLATDAIGGLFGGGGRGSFGGGAMPGMAWSQGAFGFAGGGSFRVGGAGGIDSQLMAFRATPGEMVDIRTPGQDRGDGGIVFAPVTTINAPAGISRAELKAALDQRDAAWKQSLPHMARRARMDRQ